MTLLESVIALVILSLTAIGVLGIFQQTDRNAADARAWLVATFYAEQAMEEAKLGPWAAVHREMSLSPYSAHTDMRPNRNGLRDIVVTVAVPGGAALTIHRLVQTP